MTRSTERRLDSCARFKTLRTVEARTLRNPSVTTRWAPYYNSLGSRDKVLYEDPTNVVKVGGLFKAYVESVFSRKSNEWNQIKALKFINFSRTR